MTWVGSDDLYGYYTADYIMGNLTDDDLASLEGFATVSADSSDGDGLWRMNNISFSVNGSDAVNQTAVIMSASDFYWFDETIYNQIRDVVTPMDTVTLVKDVYLTTEDCVDFAKKLPNITMSW